MNSFVCCQLPSWLLNSHSSGEVASSPYTHSCWLHWGPSGGLVWWVYLQKSFVVSGLLDTKLAERVCPPHCLRLLSERDMKSSGVVLNTGCTFFFSSFLWWLCYTPRRFPLCSFPFLNSTSTHVHCTQARTRKCVPHRPSADLISNSSSAFYQLEWSGMPQVPPFPHCRRHSLAPRLAPHQLFRRLHRTFEADFWHGMEQEIPFILLDRR